MVAAEGEENWLGRPQGWVIRSPMLLCFLNASKGGCFHTCFSSSSIKIMSQWSLRTLLTLIVRMSLGMPKESDEFPDMVCKVLRS